MLVAKPDLPSSVLGWIGSEETRVDPTQNQVVALPFTSDWGPLGSEVGGSKLYTSLAKIEAVYGSKPSPGRTAVLGAFLGMNVPGGGGAGGVIPYRMATSAVAKAASTRQNTTPTTPANAITLTAKYFGTRGNAISYAIEDDPVDGTRDRLRLLVDGVQVESYTYPQADIASLVSQINARSPWVTATLITDGVTLSPTTGTSLTGGNDGDAVTATEYAAALASLEFREFGVLSAANVTTTALKVMLATWAKDQATDMRPIRLVIGGAAGETIGDAIAELNANPGLRDEHVIRFGGGTWTDDVQGANLSTAQLAPRIAGIVAARGLRSALTSALLGGLRAVGATGPTRQDLVVARDNGVTALRRVSNPAAEVAISQGVSTFISRTTTGKPYDLFSEPRIVGVLDFVLRRITQWGNDKVIGDLPVTGDTRDLVRKELRAVLTFLEGEGLAQPGTGFFTVPDEPPIGFPDAIGYRIGFKPTRTANYLIGEGRVS